VTRILAVETTPSEVRIVRAERRLGRVHMIDCRRVACPTADAQRAVLDDARAWRPHEIVTAVPVAALAHRMLTLPFRDRRRVVETVALELLGQLPSDPGDVATGHVRLETLVTGTRVWAALVRQASLRAVCQPLATGGPPVRVDAALVGAWHLVEPSHAVDGALLLADGARSAVAVRRDGRMVGIRALSSDPAADPAAFAAEVRWALTALSAPGRTIVCGADVTVDLHAALREALTTDVVVLGDVARPAWRSEGLDACAVAAGLVAGPGLVLQDAVDATAAARRRRRLSTLAAAAALLAVVDLGLVRWRLVRRDRALETAVRTTAAAVLPPGTPIVAARTQLEAAAASLGARPANAMQVLDLLRDLSARLPSGVPMTLDELTVDGDVVRLHGSTDRYETIDVVTRALATSDFLRDVTAEDSRATIDGRGIEFGLRATWHPLLGAPS